MERLSIDPLTFLWYSILLPSFLNQGSVHGAPNHPPSFISSGDLSRFAIREDTPVGTVIYRLKGNDPENGELTFSISGEHFRVNKKSGDVSLIKALDRENEASIDVIISLTDDGHGGEPATVSLRREILVSDVNDNVPVFENTPYNFKVSEKTPVGTTIYSAIGITDEDFGPNAEIHLTCDTERSPIPCEYFGVTAEPIGEGNYIGIISLMRPLDYEKHSSFAMNLLATDGENTVSTLVAVSILDVQDQSPRFIGGPYVFKVKENAPPGTKVGEIFVQDGDTGNPRDIQIKLIDEAEHDYFRLANVKRDPFNGTFYAVVETSEDMLDAEEEFIRANLGVYELTLEAREFPLNPEDTEPTLVTRVGLAVIVQDLDDNLPAFDPAEYTQILKIPFRPDESWTFPDFKVQIEDVDEDPENAKFHLQFDWSLPTPVDQVFAFLTPSNLNPVVRSKSIIAMEVLNMTLLEPGSKFNLEIGAYQRDHLVSKLNVPIEVAENTRALPVFNNTVFRVAVPEDIGDGELITTIALTNEHLLPSVNYSLIGVGAEKFKLDTRNGEIRCGIDNCLDYERERSHFFLIRAKTGEKVDDEVYSLFYLDTQPKNDESPVFPETSAIRRSVPDGTLAFDPPFVVSATDSDLNDQLEYSIADHTMNSSGIYIHPDSGEIKLKKRLSWAEGGEHKLMVVATDKSGKSAFQSVLLIVQPLLNIPPSFPFDQHEVEIAETMEPKSTIFQVTAHDPDGQDAALRYFIHSQPEPDLFTIDENSGMISLGAFGKLDYEGGPRSYPVIVRVQDEGKPSELAKALINIIIRDINDEFPKFSTSNYVIELGESSKPGTQFLQLDATDTDETAKLEYSISCPCKIWDASGSIGSQEDAEKYFSYFRVDPKLGNITLTSSLEHKLTSVLKFEAHVQDLKGHTSQNNTASVTIYVTAAERLFPYFGEPWTPSNPWINLTVPEDMAIGSNVATLNAWDYVADEEIMTFTLMDEGEPFGLEDNIVRVTSLLDYETKKNYVISIKAIDSRGGESTANLAIKLVDINDHEPVFSKTEYKGKVAENSLFPTPILTVEASDRDDPINYGAIRYALIGPQSHLFNIDELAGVVQVAPGADIDREADSSHTIFVLALDTPLGGPFQRTAMATLRIQVTDVNDSDPICRQKEEFLVDEAASIGAPIGNITCSDADENPVLVYNLQDDTKLGLFAINSKTGTLEVAKSLRGRGRSAPYTVTVVVEDGKDRSVTTPVEIKVANTIPNDGRPQFTNKGLRGEVLEGSFPGTPVLHIQASDTDSMDNGEGRLVYRLMKQIYPCHEKQESEETVTTVEDVNYFRLDDNTGMLTLQHVIDREKHDCISLLVGVDDMGVPPRTNTEMFTITVLDLDDSLPSLPKNMRSLHLNINETTEKDSEIFKFRAIDNDIYPNDRVSFELIVGGGSGSEFFRLLPLDNQTVSLVVVNDLDKLESDEVTMVVKCFPKDKKVPLPDCSSKVHIRIHRDFVTSGRLSTNRKSIEMILGVSTGVPVGNLIGNAEMMPMEKILMSPQMYHPNIISQTPYNVSEVVRIDSNTGDIFVWDNLEPFQNGHLRVELNNTSELSTHIPLKKKVKIFIAPNSELLSTETSEFLRMNRWVDEIQNFLNQPKSNSQINNGVFRLLTFDQSNAPEGKTMVCFQLLENENMMSQEKSLQILSTPDVQDIFLKHSFADQIQKGCPQRPQGPAKLTLQGSTGRFWVERSLVGIASVVAIATLSFITILCLLNRNKVEKL